MKNYELRAKTKKKGFTISPSLDTLDVKTTTTIQTVFRLSMVFLFHRKTSQIKIYTRTCRRHVELNRPSPNNKSYSRTSIDRTFNWYDNTTIHVCIEFKIEYFFNIVVLKLGSNDTRTTSLYLSSFTREEIENKKQIRINICSRHDGRFIVSENGKYS